MKNFKNVFDFSEMNKNHQLNDITHEKVIGKMKIETSPVIELNNFVALRSKSYAYSSANKENSEQKESKILPRSHVILIHYLILEQQLQLIFLSVQMHTI